MMGLPCPTPSPADLPMPNQMNTVEIFIENTTLVIKLSGILLLLLKYMEEK